METTRVKQVYGDNSTLNKSMETTDENRSMETTDVKQIYGGN